jgi:hypothetical protein
MPSVGKWVMKVVKLERARSRSKFNQYAEEKKALKRALVEEADEQGTLSDGSVHDYKGKIHVMEDII